MNTDHIDSLIESMETAGCGTDQILAAVKHNLAKAREEQALYRAKRAAAKRAERERKCRTMSHDVAATDCDNTYVAATSPPSSPLASSPDGFPPSPYSTNNTPPSFTPSPLPSTPPSLSPPTRAKARIVVEPDRFSEFWDVYPRRVAKAAAMKAYRKALEQTPADEILDGARRYAAERAGESDEFTAHPSTWLNQGRWADAPKRGSTSMADVYAARAIEAAERERQADSVAAFERLLNGTIQ